VDVNALISAVKDNPALWDCRHEEYKLAENKPLLWLKIADQLKCEKSKYSISNCHRPSPSAIHSPYSNDDRPVLFRKCAFFFLSFYSHCL
jgi:hypothetical protein